MKRSDFLNPSGEARRNSMSAILKLVIYSFIILVIYIYRTKKVDILEPFGLGKQPPMGKNRAVSLRIHSNIGGKTPLPYQTTILRRNLIMQENNYSYFRNFNEVSVSFSRNLFNYDNKKCKGIEGAKYFMVIAYLRRYISSFGDLTFTLNHLISYCGYSTKSKNGSIKKHFINILRQLSDDGYVKYDCDFSDIKIGQQIYAKISDSGNTLFFNDENFVLLSMSEFEKIVTSKAKSNKALMIAIFLAVKQYIYFNTENSFGQNRGISYPSIRSLGMQVGVSHDTLKGVLDSLVEIGMLYRKTDLFMPDRYESNKFINARNLYALDKDTLGDHCLKEFAAAINVSKVYEKQELPEGAIIKPLK